MPGLHISVAIYGWLTLLLTVFYYSGAYFNKICVGRLGVATMQKMGLVLIVCSGLAIVLSSNFISLNIWGIIIPLIIATIGQTFIFSNCIASALHDFPNIAGTATALFSGLQIMLAAIISTLLSLIPESDQLPIGIVLVILGLGSLIALAPSLFNLTLRET